MTDFTITEDFPKSEIEFDQRFLDPKACYDYLFNTDFHSRYNRQSSTQIKRSRLSARFYRKAMGLETVFVVFQLLSELGYELSF